MPWDTDDSSGLLSHFIGTIETSAFITDSTRNDPNKPFLSWHVTVDDVLQSNFEGTTPETMTVNISIGNGWVNDENDATVEHKDGVEVFKASSAYGKIIGLVAGKAEDYGSNALVKDGDGDLGKVDLTPVRKIMQENGYDDPRVAAIWQGLTFEFRGIGFKFRDQSADDVYVSPLPVRLVGADEVTTPATAKKGKAAAKEPVDTTSIWASLGADEEAATTINDLVNSSANHAAFMKNALMLDAVKESETLRDGVMDSANFPSG